ncbi:sulfurtransferase TusA family protein [Kordiimonas aestuarii]|uniref:sulfurtransferase TusA family protein n=1 Tax=Kordiimonas aestuarii TaxID=1005925 RepID=UPI0021CFA57A|nr:sulfurtransferase TusA family protein [Kordiimonas aestuarii]
MPKSDLSQPLDLRGAFCPMAFVKTKIHLDSLSSGDTTSIIYEDIPSNEPLVRSIQSLGHKIISKTAFEPTSPAPPAGIKTESQTNSYVQLTLLKIEVNR